MPVRGHDAPHHGVRAVAAARVDRDGHDRPVDLGVAGGVIDAARVADLGDRAELDELA